MFWTTEKFMLQLAAPAYAFADTAPAVICSDICDTLQPFSRGDNK